MYMGSSDVEGTPKRKKCKANKNNENQNIESYSMIPKRKKSGDIYFENQTDRETYTKRKKRNKESHRDNAVSSSMVLYQENNEKIKKDTTSLHRDELFTEEMPCRENTVLEGRSKARKKKKMKKDHEELFLDNNFVEDLSILHTHHTNKKKKKKGEGFTEKRDESVDQSETSVKKKEKSHQETDDIAANDASSSVVLYVKENEKTQKSCKAKDPKRLHGDEHFIEETTYSKFTDLEGRSQKKKKPKKQCLDDSLAEESSTVDNQHAKKWRGGRDLQEDEHFIEETTYSKLTDLEGRSQKKKKKKQCLDNSLAEESSTVDNQHAKKRKKWKGGRDLQEDGFTEEFFSQRKSPDGKETSEQVDDSMDQSETAVRKKKREDEPHQETDDISSDDGAIASIILYREQNEKIKKSYKAKGHKGRHGDEGLQEEALYSKPADITCKQSLKNKKGCLLENSSVEEVLISETLHAKKKKSQKGGGGLQDDGFTEDLSSHRKSPDGSDAPEQVDECLGQVEKPKKKKKEDESRQVEDIAVDDASSSVCLHGHEPSCIELNNTEDRPSLKKKKKLKKDYLECPIEDSLVEELLYHDSQLTSKKKAKLKGGKDKSQRQHCFTETTEQVVETVHQAEVHVKKKVKTKKHLDRSEETSNIFAEETQPEVDQSLKSWAVESDGNVEGGLNRPQNCASTETEKNPATQGESEEVQNEGDNRLATSGKNTEKGVAKRKYKRPFIREQDLALLEEYIPNLKSLSNITVRKLFTQELERIRIAKQKGIVFHSGLYTIEEDEQIKKNVEKFMSEFGIHSAEMLFHPYKFPEQEKTIQQIKKKFQFKPRIAEGLHRTTKQVVSRGASLFENSPAKGWYSKDEVRQLKKFCELHGNNWKAIGSLLNRSYLSIQLRSAVLRQDVNRGAWSIEETNRLIAAVKDSVLDGLRREKSNNEEIVNVPKIKLYTGIKWVQIGEKVETRNYKLCLLKWFGLVMLRMNYGINPVKGMLGIQNSIKIIKWMHQSKVKEARDIKWEKLCDDIGNIPTQIAQKKFWWLKPMVKGWEKMRFYELVDRLYHEKLPELEAKLSAAGEIPIEPEKKSEFLISEIFQEWSEIDEIWSKRGSKAKVRVKGGKGHPGDPACSVPSGSQCTDACD